MIDVMEAFTEGLGGIEAVDTSMVIKYICRWKKKALKIYKRPMVLDHLIDHISRRVK